jgi:prepilin-type N-terminal cleavage/methylation domain-containing protein
MSYKRDGGVTLTEILVVIVIIAILAALALPQFTASRERALSREAKANLKLISVAEKIYRMKEGFYYPYDPGQPYRTTTNATHRAEIQEKLKVNFTVTNWNYSIDTSASPLDKFTATADRSGSGGYADCNYTIGWNITDEPKGENCP